MSQKQRDSRTPIERIKVDVDLLKRRTSSVINLVGSGGVINISDPSSVTSDMSEGQVPYWHSGALHASIMSQSGTVITVAGTIAATGLSGSNTGDVTLAGSPNYITIAGQVITRSLVNLGSHVTGNLPVANLDSGTGASSTTFWRGDGTWATGASGPTGSGTLNRSAIWTNTTVLGTGLWYDDGSQLFAALPQGGLFGITIAQSATGVNSNGIDMWAANANDAQGGSFSQRAGAVVGGNGVGGGFYQYGGDGSGSGAGGIVSMSSGAGGATGDGGIMLWNAGNAGASGGFGGDIRLSAGSAAIGFGGRIDLAPGYGGTDVGSVRLKDPLNLWYASLFTGLMTSDNQYIFPQPPNSYPALFWLDTWYAYEGLTSENNPTLDWYPMGTATGGAINVHYSQGSLTGFKMTTTPQGICDMDLTGPSLRWWRFNATGAAKVIDVLGNLQSQTFNNLTIVDNGYTATLDIAISRTLKVLTNVTLGGGGLLLADFGSGADSVEVTIPTAFVRTASNIVVTPVYAAGARDLDEWEFVQFTVSVGTIVNAVSFKALIVADQTTHGQYSFNYSII